MPKNNVAIVQFYLQKQINKKKIILGSLLKINLTQICVKTQILNISICS
jgi:hypothetical protein